MATVNTGQLPGAMPVPVPLKTVLKSQYPPDTKDFPVQIFPYDRQSGEKNNSKQTTRFDCWASRVEWKLKFK